MKLKDLKFMPIRKVHNILQIKDAVQYITTIKVFEIPVYHHYTYEQIRPIEPRAIIKGFKQTKKKGVKK